MSIGSTPDNPNAPRGGYYVPADQSQRLRDDAEDFKVTTGPGGAAPAVDRESMLGVPPSQQGLPQNQRGSDATTQGNVLDSAYPSITPGTYLPEPGTSPLLDTITNFLSPVQDGMTTSDPYQNIQSPDRSAAGRARTYSGGSMDPVTDDFRGARSQRLIAMYNRLNTGSA